MKIYFTGSIRGGRDDKEIYFEIVKHLRKHGAILTEHVADPNLTSRGEINKTEKEIHDRDLKWIKESNAIVAEVSTPSVGVGYEIRTAIERGKPVLCLYRPQQGKFLSAMILGSDKCIIREYKVPEDAIKIFDEFFAEIH